MEICINEVWGSVCDDGWSNVDANVVYRQLGYSLHSEFFVLAGDKCMTVPSCTSVLVDPLVYLHEAIKEMLNTIVS